MNFDFRDTRSGGASYSAHHSYFLTLPRDWIIKTWKNENLFHLRAPPSPSGDEKFKMTAFHVRIIHIDENGKTHIFIYYAILCIQTCLLLQSNDSLVWKTYVFNIIIF